MYSFQNALVAEGFVEEEYDFSDERNPVLFWKIGPQLQK